MNIKKIALWYFLFAKRLLKRVSFVLILLCIPLLTFLFSLAANDADTGFLRIALAAEDSSPLAAEVMERFDGDDGIIYFYIAESPESAVDDVKRQKADSAWVFSEKLEEKVVDLATGKGGTLVDVYETEGNVFLKLANERIYSSLYHAISYEKYKDAVHEMLPDTEISEEEFREAYERDAIVSKLIEFEFASADASDVSEINYLKTPLRGLLCLIMLFCTMAATMFWLADDKEGTFSFIAPGKRVFVLLINNLAATTLAGIVVTIALLLSGLYGSFITETALMLLYIGALCGFCTLLASLMPNTGAFAVLIPVVSLAHLAFTPIFINIQSFDALQTAFPLYSYLYGITDSSYALRLLAYIPVSIALALIFRTALFNLSMRVNVKKKSK